MSSVQVHVFPKFVYNACAKNINFVGTPDNVGCLLVASGGNAYAWNSSSEGHSTVYDFLQGSGGGILTEVSVSGTNYGRITNLVPSLSISGAVLTLGLGANPFWANSTISATYAAFYDTAGSTDATRYLICYWDFQGTQASSSGTFQLTLSSGQLATLTSS